MKAASTRVPATSTAAAYVPRRPVMAAMSAVIHNPDMKSFAARLKAAGKKHKVVIVAVIRKLIILANALLRSGRRWLPEAPATVGENWGKTGEKPGERPQLDTRIALIQA